MIDLFLGPNLLLYGEQSAARDLLGASIQDDLRKHAPSGQQELPEGVEKPWKMKREFLSPSCITNWNQLPEVK